MSLPFASAFQRRFGFECPAAYARAVQEERLSYRSKLPKAQRLKSYRNDPPLLICSPRIEWLGDKAVLDHEMPEYFVTTPTLVRFASGAAGEYFCFVPDWAESGAVPIAFLEADDDDARLIAPHFEGMVFREILESFAQWTFWVNEFCKLEVRPDDLVGFAERVIATSEPYLLPSHRQELLTIVKWPLNADGAFLTREETNRLTIEKLAYSRYNEKFTSHEE